jgi:hypothetical protein
LQSQTLFYKRWEWEPLQFWAHRFFNDDRLTARVVFFCSPEDPNGSQARRFRGGIFFVGGFLMAKRFTDTKKWERPWFRELSPKYQRLWLFVLDCCDVAGVWYEDFKLAEFMLGERFKRDDVLLAFQKQVKVNGSRWLIRDFIDFQYGGLKEENKLYSTLLKHLEAFENGKTDPPSIPHPSPIDGVKEKEKDGFERGIRDRGGVGEEEKEGKTVFGVEALMQLWNIRAHSNLPRVQILNKAREAHAKARLVDFPEPAFWERLIEKINSSSFLTGQSGRWKCDFDWILNSANLTKITEGNYADNEPTSPKRYQPSRG